MGKIKPNISNKTVAYNGAIVAIAATFIYSLIVMMYAIIRSSVTIYGIMPMGERNTILFGNGFSIAYSVAVFSLLMAGLSAVAGAVAAVILKKLLHYLNSLFSFNKAILISSIIALVLVALVYLFLYGLLKQWMTFNYPETFLFWFLFPAVIFIAVSIIGGSKINKILAVATTELNNTAPGLKKNDA